MKTRFYLVFNDDKAIHVTKFVERYFGVHVRLKVDEMEMFGTKL